MQKNINILQDTTDLKTGNAVTEKNNGTNPVSEDH